MMELIAPSIRADFSLSVNYVYEGNGKVLPIDFVYFGGTRDFLTFDDQNRWKDFTSKSFTIDFIEGSHFFIHKSEKQVYTLIKNKILEN